MITHLDDSRLSMLPGGQNERLLDALAIRLFRDHLGEFVTASAAPASTVVTVPARSQP